jgi:inhibitor of cysteine peptidase
MVQVDDSFNGREVSLQAGDTLEVSLSENASTGFQWSVPPELKHRFDTVIREREQAVEGSSGPPGKPGVRHLYFETIGTGTAELELHYRRSWESKAPPARKFKLRVRVRK